MRRQPSVSVPGVQGCAGHAAANSTRRDNCGMRLADFAFGATADQCHKTKDPKHHQGEQPSHTDLLAQLGRCR